MLHFIASPAILCTLCVQFFLGRARGADIKASCSAFDVCSTFFVSGVLTRHIHGLQLSGGLCRVYFIDIKGNKICFIFMRLNTAMGFLSFGLQSIPHRLKNTALCQEFLPKSVGFYFHFIIGWCKSMCAYTIDSSMSVVAAVSTKSSS